MARDGLGDGRFVARRARDERRARDAVFLQLPGPAVRQLRGGAGTVPSEAARDRVGTAAFRHENLEELRGEEMTVRVVDGHIVIEGRASILDVE